MRPVLNSLNTPLDRKDIFDRLAGRMRGGRRSFLVLARHFFRRLFLNDNIAFPDQMRQRLISVLVLFALVTGHLANSVFFKYSLVKDHGQSWVEKSYLIFFCMILMALVAVLDWDVILLDRRDFSCLVPLPVRIRTLFAAKFLSLLLMALMFAAAMNAVSMLAAWFYLPEWRSFSLFFGIRYMLAQVAAVTAAGLFTFFSAVFLVGLGMAVLGHRRFTRISVYIRGALLIASIVMLGSFLADSALFVPAFERFPVMKGQGGGELFLYPFMWFTGLYEALLGTTDPDFIRLAWTGCGALAAVAAAFFLVSFLGYRRYLKSFGQSGSGRFRVHRFRKWGEAGLNFLLLRNPTERAVYLFIRATLQRSIPLRMRITAWAAGGLGLIFVLFIFEGGGRRTGAGSGLLSAAVMGILFLMLGLRSAVRTPVSPRSRWVFRLTEIPGSMAVRRSLIKAAAVMLAAPATFMIFLMFQLGGGEMGAFQAALYGFGVALLVLNVLFSDLAMIPFACLSRPGREKLQVFWLVYIAAIFVFVKGFAALGEAVIREWMSLIGFLLSTLLFILILEAARPLLFPSGNRLVFEEPPEPVMLGLDGETSPE